MFYYMICNRQIQSFYNVQNPQIFDDDDNFKLSESEKEMYKFFDQFEESAQLLRDKLNEKAGVDFFGNMHADTTIEEEGILPIIVPVHKRENNIEVNNKLIVDFLKFLKDEIDEYTKKDSHPKNLLKLILGKPK